MALCEVSSVIGMEEGAVGCEEVGGLITRCFAGAFGLMLLKTFSNCSHCVSHGDDESEENCLRSWMSDLRTSAL